GPPPRHAEADGRPENARLRERSVDAAVRPEAVAQPRGRAKDAARAPDILAHHEHRVVARELDVEAVVHRFDDAQLSQGSASAPRDRIETTSADRRMRAR